MADLFDLLQLHLTEDGQTFEGTGSIQIPDDDTTDLLAGLESRSPNTARSYRYAVKRFLEHLAGGEFTNVTVTTYPRSLSDLAPSSRAHHISAARLFLKWARYPGLLDERPEHPLVRPASPSPPTAAI